MVNNYYLKYYVDAVELKSITKAAKKNYVSVSAVSQAILNLERAFSLKLIEHKRNSFKLTTQGYLFYKNALELLKEINSFNAQVKVNQKEITGRVEFATQQSFANLILPNILLKLQNIFPLMQPVLKVGKSRDIHRWVTNGEIDFGLAIGNTKVSKTIREPIFKGSFVCIKKKGIKKHLKFLLSGDYKEVHQFKKSYKNFHSKELPVSMYIQSWGVLAKMAVAGLGIAFVPDYHLRGLKKGSYSICRMGFELPRYEISTYRQKGAKMTPQGYLFYKKLEELVLLA